MANYQGDNNGGNGSLRLLEFQPAQNKILVRTFSPYLNSYETDSDSEFTLDCDLVLLALGFVGPERRPLLTDLGVGLTERGTVAVDANWMTTVPSS
jgi:hypothetical protein